MKKTKLLVLVLFLLPGCLASPDIRGRKPQLRLSCSNCDKNISMTKYPKKSVPISCEVSILRCKCTDRGGCSKGKFISQFYCNATEFYRNKAAPIVWEEACRLLKCKSMQAETAGKQLYPISHAGVLFPGKFKGIGKRNESVMKKAIRATDFCRTKGAYRLVEYRGLKPKAETEPARNRRIKSSTPGGKRVKLLTAVRTTTKQRAKLATRAYSANRHRKTVKPKQRAALIPRSSYRSTKRSKKTMKHSRRMRASTKRVKMSTKKGRLMTTRNQKLPTRNRLATKVHRSETVKLKAPKSHADSRWVKSTRKHMKYSSNQARKPKGTTKGRRTIKKSTVGRKRKRSTSRMAIKTRRQQNRTTNKRVPTRKWTKSRQNATVSTKRRKCKAEAGRECDDVVPPSGPCRSQKTLQLFCSGCPEGDRNISTGKATLHVPCDLVMIECDCRDDTCQRTNRLFIAACKIDAQRESTVREWRDNCKDITRPNDEYHTTYTCPNQQVMDTDEATKDLWFVFFQDGRLWPGTAIGKVRPQFQTVNRKMTPDEYCRSRTPRGYVPRAGPIRDYCAALEGGREQGTTPTSAPIPSSTTAVLVCSHCHEDPNKVLQMAPGERPYKDCTMQKLRCRCAGTPSEFYECAGISRCLDVCNITATDPYLNKYKQFKDTCIGRSCKHPQLQLLTRNDDLVTFYHNGKVMEGKFMLTQTSIQSLIPKAMSQYEYCTLLEPIGSYVFDRLISTGEEHSCTIPTQIKDPSTAYFLSCSICQHDDRLNQDPKVTTIGINATALPCFIMQRRCECTQDPCPFRFPIDIDFCDLTEMNTKRIERLTTTCETLGCRGVQAIAHGTRSPTYLVHYRGNVARGLLLQSFEANITNTNDPKNGNLTYELKIKFDIDERTASVDVTCQKIVKQLQEEYRGSAFQACDTQPGRANTVQIDGSQAITHHAGSSGFAVLRTVKWHHFPNTSLGQRNVPVYCTFCNGSLSNMADSGLRVDCAIQEVSCPCYVINKRMEKSVSVCALDHLSENEFNTRIKQWREKCRSMGCIYTQAYVSPRPYVFMRKKLLFPGKVNEPQQEKAGARVRGTFRTGDRPFFLLSREMLTDIYCWNLQLDKNLTAEKRSLIDTDYDPYIWESRPAIMCAGCSGTPTVRLPTIGLYWIDCAPMQQQCDCNFGRRESDICIESLPYCYARQQSLMSMNSSWNARFCKECTSIAAYYPKTAATVPLDTDDGNIYSFQADGPNATFSVATTARKETYCASQESLGLLKNMETRDRIRGFLMCTFCDDEPWDSRILANRVDCAVTKIHCPCYTCRTPTGAPPEHCLPLCDIPDRSAYQSYVAECAKVNCKRPQVIYNSDWYLLYFRGTILPGVYKFRMYGSMRRVDNETSAEYCPNYSFNPAATASVDRPCLFDRDFYARPDWTSQVGFVCVKNDTQRNYIEKICANGKVGLPCGDGRGLMRGGVATVNGQQAYETFQSTYDRLLRLCTKGGYKWLVAEDFKRFKIFGTGELTPTPS